MLVKTLGITPDHMIAMSKPDALTLLNFMTESERVFLLADCVDYGWVSIGLPIREIDAEFVLERWIKAWEGP